MRNIKMRIITLAFCSAVSLPRAIAQMQASTTSSYSLLNLVELPESSSQIKITDDFRIIEPNSKVQVSFNKDDLNKILADYTLDTYTANRLSILKNMLSNQTSAMNSLDTAYALYSQNKPVSEWIVPLRNIGRYSAAILKDQDSRRMFSSVLKEVQAVNPPQNDKDRLFSEYNALFVTASKMIPQILTQIQAATKSEGVYIQMGAWLDAGGASTPIHINGFDDYTSQTPSTVQRFIVTLNAQQQADLNTIATLSDSANKNGLAGTIKQLAVNAGTSVANKLSDLPSYNQATALIDTLQTLVAQDQAQLGTDKQTIIKAYNDVFGFVEELKVLINKYNQPVTGTDANQLLLQVNSDVNQLTTDIEVFQSSLTLDIDSIVVLTASATTTLKAQVDAIKSSLLRLKGTIITDVNDLRNSNSFFQQLFLGQQVASISHDFTDKVHQLTIDALPQNTLIDLTISGARDQGSRFHLKVAVGKAGQQAKDQYDRDFDLYFCSIYARTAVGFLFVNPVPIFKRNGENALFRYAPSYSVLLKGFWKSAKGARKSVAYHKFFDPGLGVNFSALDFKGDGSMALGIGGVLTLFNDFVQLGSGINTFDGQGYVFFGFRLPVGSFTMR